MPTMQKVSPTGRNSNKANPGRCDLTSKPLAATLVDVPTSVQVPPMIDAKARGMSVLLGLMRLFRQTARTAGKKTAVVVVLFIKADVPQVSNITIRRTRLRLLPEVLQIRSPKPSITPV
jgi:hypothetical protein